MLEHIFGVVTPVASSGWPLRNFLVYLKAKLKLSKATILQYRTDKANTNDISPSDIIEVDLIAGEELKKEECGVAGWERNSDGKLVPRYLNLEGTMDPIKLASSAVDLNLKLMRWRLLPNLDLEKVSQTKCLLLGAGTLGCNVARNLLVRIFAYILCT
jgi:ubiquitin-like modifier-activating enzyme ATG7